MELSVHEHDGRITVGIAALGAAGEGSKGDTSTASAWCIFAGAAGMEAEEEEPKSKTSVL